MTPAVLAQIEPGDAGWDAGGGLIGSIIRTAVPWRRGQSAYAHCWIYHHQFEPGVWLTAEAYWPDGLQWRIRDHRLSPPTKVSRVWRTPSERFAILTASAQVLRDSTGYDLAEIFRMVAWMFGLDTSRWVDRHSDRYICSHHVAKSLTAGRPDLAGFLAHPPEAIWPGALAEAVDVVGFADSVVPQIVSG